MPTVDVYTDYVPRQAFNAFHDRTERDAIMVCHRRAGKTVAIANDAQERCLSITRQFPPARIAWFYPTRVRAKDIAWPYLKHYSKNIPGARPIESELAIEYPHMGRVTLYGADNARGVGLWLDGVYYDEDDDIPQKTRSEVEPTLADYSGFSVRAGMLKGRYNLWPAYDKARMDPKVFKLLMRADESGIIAPEELARLRDRMGEAAYQMQLLCNPNAAIANAIYGKQMDDMRREGRIVPKIQVDPAVPLYAFADIGHSLTGDDWSWWFIQISHRDYLIHEYYARTGEVPAHYAAKILEVQDRLGVRVTQVFLPHDGAMKDRHGRSAKDDLEAAGLANRVRVVDRTPNVWDSINDVRAVLPQCYVSQAGCGEGWTLGEMEMPCGIDCLDYYTKKIEVQTGLITEKPEHNQYSHGADAFRTFVEALTHGLVEGRSPVERLMVEPVRRHPIVTRERPPGWQQQRMRR